MSKSLLMIHGMGCGGDVWDRMKPEFEAAGWACEAPTLFPDLRTIEEPPEGIGRLGLRDYIDDMATRCQAIESATGTKPAVIGHSMGGLVAQALAAEGHVSQAVFLTPAQTKECAKVGLSVAWTFGNVLLSGKRDKGHKVWKRGFIYGVVNQVPKDRHEEIYATARYDSGKVYGDIGDGWEIDEAKVNVPTLTIAAGKDRATLPGAVRKVANKYAKSPVPGEFKLYPDNAHWIVDEPGTDQVTNDIIAWLERTRG